MFESIRRRPHLWAAVILLISGAARFWFIFSNQLDLVQDEAQYWDWTRHLQITYYSKAGLIAWIIASGPTSSATPSSACGSAPSWLPGVPGHALSLPGADVETSRDRGAHAVHHQHLAAVHGSGCAHDHGQSPAAVLDGVHVRAVRGRAGGRETEPGESAPAPGGPAPFVVLALFLGVGVVAKYTMLLFVGLSMVYAGVLHLRSMLPARFWKRWAVAMAAGLVSGFCPPSYGTP